MTALARVNTGTDVPDDVLKMMDVAKFMAASKMLPRHLAGDEASILSVMMWSRSLNIPMSVGFQEIIVQKGKVGMTVHLMSALVKREGAMSGDGSTIVPIEELCDATTATVRAYRPGIGHGRCGHADVTFSIEDAKRAGLVTIKQDGTVIARSKEGAALPWENYTADMLLWRATSRASRRYFSDVLMGMNYTPDELGNDVDEDGQPIHASAVRVNENDPETVELSLRIAAAETQSELRHVWQAAKNRGLLEREVDGVTLNQRVNLRLKDLPPEPDAANPETPAADVPVDAETVEEATVTPEPVAEQDTPDPEQDSPEPEQAEDSSGFDDLVAAAAEPTVVADPEDTREDTPRRQAVENKLSSMFEALEDLESAGVEEFGIPIDLVSTDRLQAWALVLVRAKGGK